MYHHTRIYEVLRTEPRASCVERQVLYQLNCATRPRVQVLSLTWIRARASNLSAILSAVTVARRSWSHHSTAVASQHLQNDCSALAPAVTNLPPAPAAVPQLLPCQQAFARFGSPFFLDQLSKLFFKFQPVCFCPAKTFLSHR